MAATLLTGEPIAKRLKAVWGKEIEALRRKGVQPKVAALHNSANAACRIYRKMQQGLCDEFSIPFEVTSIQEGTSTQEVRERVQELNGDPKITGITVHWPLPDPIDPNEIMLAVSPRKDIEGTHPQNLGMLSLGPHTPAPCAARAALEILRTITPSFKGLEVIIVGHSTLVGKAIANLLLQSKYESATPTICHVATTDMAFHTRRADVLIVAAGKAGLVRGDMIKQGAVVIDIGVNRTAEGKLVGDVVFDEAKEVAGAITPVPGGVGPVTIALLLRNIIDCAAHGSALAGGTV